MLKYEVLQLKNNYGLFKLQPCFCTFNLLCVIIDGQQPVTKMLCLSIMFSPCTIYHVSWLCLFVYFCLCVVAVRFVSNTWSTRPDQITETGKERKEHRAATLHKNCRLSFMVLLSKTGKYFFF